MPFEIVPYNSKHNEGTLRFDVLCKCECGSIDKDNKVINKFILGVDVEMQIKYQDKYIERFFLYNYALNSAYEYPFIVISLLNCTFL